MKEVAEGGFGFFFFFWMWGLDRARVNVKARLGFRELGISQCPT